MSKISHSLKSICMQAICYGTGHVCSISNIPGKMPNWMSYRGEGCSLSFHIPPVFQGLFIWFPLWKDEFNYQYFYRIIIIIRNKSNGIQLFEEEQTVTENGGLMRRISRSEMGMEDYCGDDELELHIYSEPPLFAVDVDIAKSNSFEESQWERDIMIVQLGRLHSSNGVTIYL